jgi:ABC-type nitrate/sulfonate/bicarbonate transport system permease component
MADTVISQTRIEKIDERSGWVWRTIRWPFTTGRPQALSLVVLLGGWEIIGWVLNFPFLPPFSVVLQASWELILSGEILGNLAASLVGLTIGYSLAAILGVTVGAMMGRYRRVEYLLDIYVNAFLASPTLIFVPILFALFGVSRLSQVAVVFLYSFWLITSNTFVGIRTVDGAVLEMARSFGASERQLFWKIMLPGSLPMVMAGLRIGMGRAVKGMINGELFIALIGLGALLKTYGGRFDSAKVLGILIVIILVAVITTSIVQAIDRRVTRWAD